MADGQLLVAQVEEVEGLEGDEVGHPALAIAGCCRREAIPGLEYLATPSDTRITVRMRAVNTALGLSLPSPWGDLSGQIHLGRREAKDWGKIFITREG